MMATDDDDAVAVEREAWVCAFAVWHKGLKELPAKLRALPEIARLQQAVAAIELEFEVAGDHDRPSAGQLAELKAAWGGAVEVGVIPEDMWTGRYCHAEWSR